MADSMSSDMTAEEAAAEVVAEENRKEKQYPSLVSSTRKEYRNPRPEFPPDEIEAGTIFLKQMIDSLPGTKNANLPELTSIQN